MSKPKNDFTPAKSSMEAYEEALLKEEEVDFLEVVPQLTLPEARLFGMMCDCGQNMLRGPHVCFGTVLADQEDDDEDND